jgi:hypothetical protein
MRFTNYNVELLDNKISDYESILSKFSNWKENKRQINLLSVLDGKKIQFEVEIENSSSVFYIDITQHDSYFGESIIGACSVINKLTFIILDGVVINLNIDFTIINTKYGNLLKDILECGVELKLRQNIDEEKQISRFYFDNPKQVA